MSKKILLVDDNTAVRQVIRFYIEENTDFQVCGEAENGKLAIDMAKQCRPDVVILDFAMPVMNGLDAARKITSVAPKTQIIMFTIHGSDKLRRNAQEVGVGAVISKDDDYTLQQLVERIKEATKGQFAA